MKILLLTPDIPYPSQSGAAIRNWGVIRGLVEAGHELSLLSFRDGQLDSRSEALRDHCGEVISLPLPGRSKLSRLGALLASGRADMEARLACADFSSQLRRLLGENSFDIIQFSGLELGGYLDVIKRGRGSAKLVYDALNAEADLQRVIAGVDSRQPRRWPAMLYSLAQTRRLRAFEARICRGVDAVIAVSNEDRRLLRQYAGAPITVMANGIHTADYAPHGKRGRNSRLVVFTGKMDYRPNVDAIEWFCAEILPLIRRRRPAFQLTVVGRNPHARLQKLAAAGDIQLTGWVDSVLPTLHEAALYLVPLRMGSGTRLKLLQAMAAGCPLISTSIGAAGINAQTRRGILIADEAQDFAAAVMRLLADDDERGRMSELARQQVGEHYDWHALMPTLLQVYARLSGG